MEKTSLYYKSEGSNKEYHITLENGTVTVQYGRRGSALTSLVKCQNCEYDKALKIYQKLINEKKSKGYQLGEGGTIYSSPTDANQTGYAPQLLNEIDEAEAVTYIHDDEWLMQEKEDGRNIGILVKSNKAIASNKKGISISIPENILMMVEEIFDSGTTLCGELIGETFKVWDILYYYGYEESIPYIERYEYLESVLGQLSHYVKLTKTAITFDEKIALYKEMKEKNAEGVVFKRKDSLYKAGRPNSGGDQLKYKFRATCSVMVGKKKIDKNSVEMWLLEKKEDVIAKNYVGNVTIYPNQEVPEEDSIIEVRYLYAFKGGSLFQPVYIGPRDDVFSEECTMSQLKYKRELEEEE